MSSRAISAADPCERRRIPVLDSDMAYIDIGEGEPVVFLHGNPTSSYLWRNIIPHLGDQRRCLAPDLIGMGSSGKLPRPSYHFVDHVWYLDALALRGKVTLVMHDWGSALGFYWAQRHPDQIKGLVYLEALVRPVAWQEWPEQARTLFQALRSPAGEQIILEKNVFVERILPASVMRPLSDEEMAVYRRPYLVPGESRRPTLTWPREIPIEGEPADVTQIVDGYARWLAVSTIPKLFINADPGSILTGAQREFCRAFPQQEEITVMGIHFVQEDSPGEIGAAVASFLERIS